MNNHYSISQLRAAIADLETQRQQIVAEAWLLNEELLHDTPTYRYTVLLIDFLDAALAEAWSALHVRGGAS